MSCNRTLRSRFVIARWPRRRGAVGDALVGIASLMTQIGAKSAPLLGLLSNFVFNALSPIGCFATSSFRRQQFERDYRAIARLLAILEYANVDRRTLS